MSDIIMSRMTTKTKKMSKKPAHRVAAKHSGQKVGTETSYESDGTYLLKLVVFVLLGTFWLKFADPATWNGIPLRGLPIGLLVGLLLVRQFEKHQSDRKIWYACLIVVTIISFFIPAGVVI